jgi:hypothetical protein
MASTLSTLRRSPPPKWVRRFTTALIAVTFAPLARLFPRRFARVLARSMTGTFGRSFGRYVPQKGDVVVCSYFKSGTNWTLQIALQITHRGRALYDHIHDVVPWPDMPDRFRFAVPPTDDWARRASPTGLRVLKTHLALGVVPYTQDARYICVVRDPKDVFVSSYHFTKANAGAQLMPPPAEWLNVYLSPDTPFGSWAAHLASYWSARSRTNVLFLTYERMSANLPGTVDEIAAFLDVSLTDAERASVIAQASFDHMKRIGQKFDAPGAPWASAAGAMFRRGQRGASAELLSPADQRRIDDYWRAELQRLGCDFPYDEAFGVTAAP